MNKIVDHIRQYSCFLKWLIQDLYANYRWRLLFIVVGSYIGLALQTSAVYISYHYAKVLEKNTILHWQNWTVIPRESVSLMVVTASTILVIATMSAFLIMWSKNDSLMLARDYANYCIKRLYVLVSNIPSVSNALRDPGFRDVTALQRLRRNAWYCGIVVRILIFALLPIATTIVAGIALMIIDPLLTMIVFAILIFTSFYFYKDSIQGASYRILLQRRSPGASREYQLLNKRVMFSSAFLGYMDSGIEEFFQNGNVAEFGDAFIGQRRVLEHSYLIAQLAAGVTLFLIILVQGAATLSNENEWSALLIYLVAFVFFTTAFAKTARMLTSINRFYPSVSNYSKFVRDFQEVINDHGLQSASSLVLAVHELEGDKDHLELTKGDRVAVIQPEKANRFSLIPLTNCLLDNKSDHNSHGLHTPWLVCQEFPVSGCSLREGFGFPKESHLESICNELKMLGLHESKFNALPDMDRLLTASDTGRFNQELIFLLSALAGIHRGCYLFAISQTGLSMLEPDICKKLLSLFSSSIIYIIYTPNNKNQIGHFAEPVTLIANIDCVVCWCRSDMVNSDIVNDVLIKSGVYDQANRKHEGSESQIDVLDEF